MRSWQCGRLQALSRTDLRVDVLGFVADARATLTGVSVVAGHAGMPGQLALRTPSDRADLARIAGRWGFAVHSRARYQAVLVHPDGTRILVDCLQADPADVRMASALALLALDPAAVSDDDVPDLIATSMVAVLNSGTYGEPVTGPLAAQLLAMLLLDDVPSLVRPQSPFHIGHQALWLATRLADCLDLVPVARAEAALEEREDA